MAATDLRALIGTWEGRGHGTYPTIEPFDYTEVAVYAEVPGKPFLTYEQRTRAADDGRPLHREVGFARPGVDGAVELVLAQPTGHAEVHTGTFDGGVLDVATVGVLVSPTAKDVTALTRRIEVDGAAMRYTVSMAAVGEPLQVHLVAELRRS